MSVLGLFHAFVTEPKFHSLFRRLDYAAWIFLIGANLCLAFVIFYPPDIPPMSWIIDLFAKF
jgi:predicted membrane channel-forming protein YqfA (hemolysin III family)